MNENISKLHNDAQDPETVRKVYTKVKDLLTSGEEILYIAVQKKPAVTISPDCITLTNKRAIFCRPKAFGFTMTFEDYAWKDVADCHMKEEFFGAEFKLRSVSHRISIIDYLPKTQARRLYQIGQEKEEEHRELRRQRELENKRASAGGVTVNTSVPQSPAAPVTAEGPLESLQKLKMLLENGFISQQEFDEKKAGILSRL